MRTHIKGSTGSAGPAGSVVIALLLALVGAAVGASTAEAQPVNRFSKVQITSNAADALTVTGGTTLTGEVGVGTAPVAGIAATIQGDDFAQLRLTSATTGTQGITFLDNDGSGLQIYATGSGGGRADFYSAFTKTLTIQPNTVTVSGVLSPDTDGVRTLGTASRGWKNGYFVNPDLATTSTDGLLIRNTTAATSGVPVQISPRLRFESHAWNTTATAADNYLEAIQELVPYSAATPSAEITWSMRRSTDGATGGYVRNMFLNSAGAVYLFDPAIDNGRTTPGMSTNMLGITTNDWGTAGGSYIYSQGTATPTQAPVTIAGWTRDGLTYPAVQIDFEHLNQPNGLGGFPHNWRGLELCSSTGVSPCRSRYLTVWGNGALANYVRNFDAQEGDSTPLTTTSTDGIATQVSTPATLAEPVRLSPRVRMIGSAWDTDDAVGRDVSFFTEVLPASAATVTGTWRVGYIDPVTAAITYRATLQSDGRMDLVGTNTSFAFRQDYATNFPKLQFTGTSLVIGTATNDTLAVGGDAAASALEVRGRISNAYNLRSIRAGQPSQTLAGFFEETDTSGSLYMTNASNVSAVEVKTVGLSKIPQLSITGNLLTFGGALSTVPALTASGAVLQARLGDDSADTTFRAGVPSAGGVAFDARYNGTTFIQIKTTASGSFKFIDMVNNQHLIRWPGGNLSMTANGQARWLDDGTVSHGLEFHFNGTGNGGLPTCASGCGTGASIPTTSSDAVGRVTLGTGASTASVVLNYGVAWAVAPVCFVKNETSNSDFYCEASTTQMTFTGTFADGDVLAWSTPWGPK